MEERRTCADADAAAAATTRGEIGSRRLDPTNRRHPSLLVRSFNVHGLAFSAALFSHAETEDGQKCVDPTVDT